MSEMLEKVAAHIWEEAGFAKMHPEGFAARPEHVRARYLRSAAAAVRALREPDSRMTIAGSNTAIRDWSSTKETFADDPRPIFRAMIDSILSDAEGR